MAKEKTAKAAKDSKKTGKAKDLAAKDAQELKDNVKALKKEALNLRFQKASGQLQNTARMKEVRKEIARSKTILTQQATAADGKGE